MSFVTNYNKLEQLYETYLTTIKGIKFTFREVDIIACIVHNRGDKKVASLLSLSPRTVNAHVYNITNKLGCNSKDQIIDFIESSGRLKIFREYYLNLLVKAKFERQMIKIGNQINRKVITFYCSRNEVSDISNTLYQTIYKHLKLANIEIVEVTSNNEDSFLRFELKKITELNYYHDLFKHLSELLNSPQTKEIIQEFNDAYKAIEDTYDGKDNIEQGQYLFNRPFVQKSVIYVCIFFVLVIAIGILRGYRDMPKPDRQSTSENITPQIIKNLEEFLKLIKQEQFSADNTKSENASLNQSLIKQVEKILQYQTTKEVQEYFNKAEMSSDILIDYLYNLQALSAYYMYNKHDGIKAREILLYAKKTGENYINSRTNIIIDFDRLTGEEIFSELQIIKDLPQIYTRLIYSLARTYIYTGDYILGKPYFELVKHLGNKLNLLEGYLSEINGILIIEKEQINSYIKEGNITLAVQKLKTIIQAYNEMKNDNRSYIDFKPGSNEQVIPSKQVYNLFYCNTKIIEHYGTLIELGRPAEIKGYIQEINDLLQGNEESQGLFKLLDQVPPRRVASLYNTLGYIFLSLSKLERTESELNREIEKLLSINTHNNLKLAEGLFDKAISISRSTDYTKADAYNGLIIVYQQRIVENTFTDEEKKELLDKINDLLNKRDHINQLLYRKKGGSTSQ